MHPPSTLLIDQVGHFTEGLTELKILVQAQAETAQKQLDRMAQTVEQQSHHIERIASAIEASNRSQAEAINRLAAIVDRLLPPQP